MSRPRLLLGVQIATVVAILACVVALAALHPHRLDLTPERRFTLSAHTREVLARLHDDVRITAFYSSQEGVIRREMADLLALYQEAQPRIAIRLLDRISMMDLRAIARGGARQPIVTAARKRLNL